MNNVLATISLLLNTHSTYPRWSDANIVPYDLNVLNFGSFKNLGGILMNASKDLRMLLIEGIKASRVTYVISKVHIHDWIPDACKRRAKPIDKSRFSGTQVLSTCLIPPRIAVPSSRGITYV
jgi:hypothetical protein